MEREQKAETIGHFFIEFSEREYSKYQPEDSQYYYYNKDFLECLSTVRDVILFPKDFPLIPRKYYSRMMLIKVKKIGVNRYLYRENLVKPCFNEFRKKYFAKTNGFFHVAHDEFLGLSIPITRETYDVLLGRRKEKEPVFVFNNNVLNTGLLILPR